jgi:hypothetical protein
MNTAGTTKRINPNHQVYTSIPQVWMMELLYLHTSPVDIYTCSIITEYFTYAELHFIFPVFDAISPFATKEPVSESYFVGLARTLQPSRTFAARYSDAVNTTTATIVLAGSLIA